VTKQGMLFEAVPPVIEWARLPMKRVKSYALRNFMRASFFAGTDERQSWGWNIFLAKHFV
jgi:hypothetical protein